jgi:hypothetical protein
MVVRITTKRCPGHCTSQRIVGGLSANRKLSANGLREIARWFPLMPDTFPAFMVCEHSLLPIGGWLETGHSTYVPQIPVL